MKGTVKWFDDMKGFGFITPEDGSGDCFVHHSEIRDTGFKTLDEGEKVEFKRVEQPKGPAAENVVRLKDKEGGAEAESETEETATETETETTLETETETETESETESETEGSGIRF